MAVIDKDSVYYDSMVNRQYRYKNNFDVMSKSEYMDTINDPYAMTYGYSITDINNFKSAVAEDDMYGFMSEGLGLEDVSVVSSYEAPVQKEGMTCVQLPLPGVENVCACGYEPKDRTIERIMDFKDISRDIEMDKSSGSLSANVGKTEDEKRALENAMAYRNQSLARLAGDLEPVGVTEITKIIPREQYDARYAEWNKAQNYANMLRDDYGIGDNILSDKGYRSENLYDVMRNDVSVEHGHDKEMEVSEVMISPELEDASLVQSDEYEDIGLDADDLDLNSVIESEKDEKFPEVKFPRGNDRSHLPHKGMADVKSGEIDGVGKAVGVGGRASYKAPSEPSSPDEDVSTDTNSCPQPQKSDFGKKAMEKFGDLLHGDSDVSVSNGLDFD